MLQGWLGKTRVLLPRQRQDMGLFAERHFDVDQPTTPPQIEFARFPMSHSHLLHSHLHLELHLSNFSSLLFRQLRLHPVSLQNIAFRSIAPRYNLPVAYRATS